MNNKEYLGDAVYARTDRNEGLILTTENGIKATNIIVLIPGVWQKLLDFMKREGENNDVK